jgi:Lon protease-like protein
LHPAPRAVQMSPTATADALYDGAVAALATQEELPVLLFVPLLPAQRLTLRLAEPAHLHMLKHCMDNGGGVEAGGGRFGMLALDPGTQQLLGFGTECEVLGVREGDEGDGVCIDVIGRRPFALAGEVWTEGRYQASRVVWHPGPAIDELGAQAPSMAVLQASERLEVLVNEWLRLARGRGARVQDVDGSLGPLGPMPPAHRPSARAMWAASLINPAADGAKFEPLSIPEMRHVMLAARDTAERLRVVSGALCRSISALQAGQLPHGGRGEQSRL